MESRIKVYLLKRGNHYYRESQVNDKCGLTSATYTDNIYHAHCFENTESVKFMQSLLAKSGFGEYEIVKASAVLMPRAVEEL